MTCLFSLSRHYFLLFLCLLFAGCTVPVKEDIKVLQQNEVQNFTSNYLGNDEVLAHSEPIHFYLRRWDNYTAGPGELSYYCNNDLLIVTNKRLYIVENYRPIEKHFFQNCSRETGSSILRPYSVYAYPLDSIKYVEITKTDWLTKTPLALSITFTKGTGYPERIYFAVLDTVHTMPNGRKSAAKNRRNAINPSGSTPIRNLQECPPDGASDEHTCSIPISGDKNSPFFECGSINRKLLSKKSWRSEPKSPVPHQWSTVARWKIDECPNDIDLWSSDKSIATTLSEANDNHILYIGDERNDGSCSHKLYGYWSTKEYTINNCKEDWYQVGGRNVGPCIGKNGMKVRRYVVGVHNCYVYDKIDGVMTIDEYYGRK